MKNYEKINVNLRDEDDVQFFRTTIFENENEQSLYDEENSIINYK